jgi:hypothetical protein
MLLCGADVIIFEKVLSCGANFYHLRADVIMWGCCYHVELMLSCGRRHYHMVNFVLENSKIIFDVIMWYYYVMLSCENPKIIFDVIMWS